MSAYEDYWLFSSAHGEMIESTNFVVHLPFVSLEEARRAAKDLGGAIDILGAPACAGALRVMEHVDATRERGGRRGPLRVGSFRTEGPSRP